MKSQGKDMRRGGECDQPEHVVRRAPRPPIEKLLAVPLQKFFHCWYQPERAENSRNTQTDLRRRESLVSPGRCERAQFCPNSPASLVPVAPPKALVLDCV